ncbi:hypothetical protein HQ533_00460 [Candidatus Woesearchaeota archaeon]|nr:hypothetical protein [Candidatus Woesearchaeota archaeon]
MNNKHLGLILVVVCVVLGILLFTFNELINSQTADACSCTENDEDAFCPHQHKIPWQIYIGILLVAIVAALGFYLLLFEKSQKEILSALSKQKELKIEEEKFSILLKGMDEYEQKVIKAVKDQDGITQQTLKLRVDMHKSKLSIVLDGLEKKGLVKRVPKGKTNQVFLKIAL